MNQKASRLEQLLAEAALMGGPATEEWLDQFAEAASGALLPDGWSDLFSEDLAKDERRRIAICLLRLVAANRHQTSDDGFRIKLIALTDSVLPDIYQCLEIQPGQQTFQKISELEAFIPKIESKLATDLAPPSNLAAVSGIRQKTMRALNAKQVKPVVTAFLADGAVVHLLDGFLAAAEEYARTGVEPLPEAHAEAEARYRELRSALAQSSRYDALVDCLATGVHDLLATHFADSPANRPAVLNVHPTEKKQPLHQTGPLDLRLRIDNVGAGTARDVAVELHPSSLLSLEEPRTFVGSVPPGELLVAVAAELTGESEGEVVTGEITWRDPTGQRQREEFIFEVEPQRVDINWGLLEYVDAYSLEPVASDRDLVGRTDVLNQLHAMAEAAASGNAYIYGQRRVGKTSIAKTLMSRLREADHEHRHVAVYVEAGDYIRPAAAATVSALGTVLCELVLEADVRYRTLDPPEFTDALSPLTGFMRKAAALDEAARFTLILDEFDTLPPDLFRRSEVGDAFFQTLRSLAGKRSIGLILVGGENMEQIIATHDDMVNKFRPVRVDYFNRSTDWPDYCDLVRKPVSDWLEVSDEAISTLYEAALGNPYFSNLICREMASRQVARRDGHVTRQEMLEAVAQTVQSVGSNSFSHFWRDGIMGTGAAAEAISIATRKVLLGLAQCLRSGSPATEDCVAANAYAFGVGRDETRRHLDRLAERSVLRHEDEQFSCGVPLFEHWLRERGQREIVTSTPDLEVYLEELRLEESAYVSAGEISDLIGSWGSFKAKRVDGEAVRAWLDQFSSASDQRLMFRLLQAIDFYPGPRIRELLYSSHADVCRKLGISSGRERYGRGKERRSDILLSHLDDVGKSGAQYARMYADENGILVGSIAARAEIAERLASASPDALIFVDDFVGTGNSLSDNLRWLKEYCGEALDSVAIGIVTIVGTETGVQSIEAVARQLDLRVTVHSCVLSGDEDQCFDGSRVFRNSDERKRARDIAYEQGVQLVSRNPLGYGDLQSLVVFESSIPNNCLPILWHSKSSWRPLFRRI